MEQAEQSLSRPDRDMLVSLNVKVDQLGLTVKDIKDGLVARVVKLETRADATDVYHARINLERYDRLADWVESFKSNYKMTVIILGFAFGSIGGLIDHILTKMFHF